MCGRARCTVRVDAVGAACGFRAPLRSVNADRYINFRTWLSSISYSLNCLKKKKKKFNARSESVHQKTSFRRLLSKNRCLATVEGFYEWKKDGKKKQPYYVHMEDGHPLVFAALYDTWESPEGEIMYTFTILTTRVSKRLEWLHDRMPVVLKSQGAIDSWLNDDLSEDVIHKLTQPYEAPDLIWYPVTPAMGRPAFNGPECIEEIKPKVASESKIAQMFGKQLAQENSTRTDKGTSQDIMDEDYLNEEDYKALLAGMEPDQDVSQALGHSEQALDGSIRNATPNDGSLLKQQLFEGSKLHQDKDTEIPVSSPQLVKSEDKGDCLSQTNKEEKSAASGKEHGMRDISRTGPTSLKTSPVSTPVKTQARKAATTVKDHDSKRQRINDTLKDSPKDALHAGVKQKQSNLLGFFSKQ